MNGALRRWSLGPRSGVSSALLGWLIGAVVSSALTAVVLLLARPAAQPLPVPPSLLAPPALARTIAPGRVSPHVVLPDTEVARGPSAGTGRRGSDVARAAVGPSRRPADAVDAAVGTTDYADACVEARTVRRIDSGGRVFLFMCERSAYETSVDRHYFQQFAAMRARDDVAVEMWGPGWQGYVDVHGQRWNLEQRYGSALADNILGVYVMGGAAGDEVKWVSAAGVPVVVRMHGSHGGSSLRGYEAAIGYERAYRLGVDVVLHAFAYEMMSNQYHGSPADHKHRRRLFVHVPPAASASIFYKDAAQTSDRDIDVLYIGTHWMPSHPLLVKLLEMGKAGKFKMAKVEVAWDTDQASYDEWKHDPSAYTTSNERDAQIAVYAHMMKRAKVILVSPSRMMYQLQEYAEALLAGALLIGGVPWDNEEDFRKSMLELDINQSEDQIAQIICWWLEHEMDRVKLAKAGQRGALARHTWAHRVQDLLDAVVGHRNGERGFKFPHPFRFGCTAESSNVLKNIYCTDNVGAASRWGSHPEVSRLAECRVAGTCVEFVDRPSSLRLPLPSV